MINSKLSVGSAPEDIVEKASAKGLVVDSSFPVPVGNPSGHAHGTPPY